MTDIVEPVDADAFAERYGPWAVVAGGANGLGAAYCRALADLGIDLVVLDRDDIGLHRLRDELRGRPEPVQVRIAAVDLAAEPAVLLDAVRAETDGLDVGLLVLNAAWSPVGPFVDTELAALLIALDLNCRATVVLSHEFGRRLAARGRGGIVVMSSIAAETGTANVALYSATKAFDLVLAEGLWYELRDRGVDVVAVRPGSTRTPGWESTQPADGEIEGVMEPAAVVAEALGTLGRTPSFVAGAANRSAEQWFRSMPRAQVIELMSGITRRLVPHHD